MVCLFVCLSLLLFFFTYICHNDTHNPGTKYDTTKNHSNNLNGGNTYGLWVKERLSNKAHESEFNHL